MSLYSFFNITLLLLIICDTIRGIVDPKRYTQPKRYMVYLTTASDLSRYDNWICGGAIVSPDFIITSAACVKDVKFIYAVAGYDTYKKGREFDVDQCILKTKKKVVFTCVPKGYNFTYNRYEDWAYIDIALAKVETPYKFDRKIAPECTWIPNSIDLSYDYRHVQPGSDAMVLGWGSAGHWRSANDSRDFNMDALQFAPVLLTSKENCKKYYIELPTLFDTIDKYMICSFGRGNLDDAGRVIIKTLPNSVGCSTEDVRCVPQPILLTRNVGPIFSQRKNLDDNDPNTNLMNISDKSATIRSSYGYTFPYMILGEKFNHSRRFEINQSSTNTHRTRRYGFCQNDHGGPLITWVGGKEILIGIASVFLLRNSSCVGPFLYTSTNCNGAFLGCVLAAAEKEYALRNRDDVGHPMRYEVKVPIGFNPAICDMPPDQRGFDIERRSISWKDHPHGPAANELKASVEEEAQGDLFERPQIPLDGFAK